MSQSVTHYVDVSVALEGVGPQPAGFGTPMFMYQHALESARLAGPFTTAQEVLDAGHANGSPPHLFAQALLRQSPRPRSFYIGRADAADADVGASLEAIVAANTGAWYAGFMESRDTTDILDWAAALEALAFPKISLVQSSEASLLSGDGPSYTVTFVTASPPPGDGDYTLTFTGFGLPSPVDIDVTVTGGSPATDALLAAAFDAALDTAAGTSGSLEDVVDPASISSALGVLSFSILDGLAAGTVTSSTQAGTTMTVAMVDGDVGSRMFDLQYTRTGLVYHPTDAEMLAESWAARCLSFDLDQRKGIWSYKRLNGIAGTSLTNSQVTALRNVNANYFAPAVMSSGNAVQAFTAQGWFPSGDAAAGRRIDITTTLDWAKARLEEATLGVLLRETHGVPLSDAGINRFATAARGHFSRGVAAGHYLPFQVPEGEDYEGLQTPAIFVPKVADLTASERASRTFTFSAVAYLQNYIEKVQFNVEVRQ